MPISNKIAQIQTQKLILSNKLVQSLKILNMSKVELEVEIEREAEENPLLDLQKIEENVDFEKYFKKERIENKFDKNEKSYIDSSEYNFENIMMSKDSMYDRLHGQVSIMNISSIKKKICHYLIDSLDKDGYLRENERDISNKFLVDEKTVKKCVKIIQSFEPSGIGARSLSECLILQIRAKKIHNDKLEKIIINDLNLIANSNLKLLSTKYNSSLEEIKEIIKIIKNLDPKPTSDFYDESIVYSYPDVIVEVLENEVVVKSYTERDSLLEINDYYRELLINSEDKDVKKYLKEKLEAANRLINIVDERNNTILNIAEAIIEIQKDFFLNNKPLKPMTLHDISDKIGCHISTVSRGINGKYMLTSTGLYEFESFFTSSVEQLDGENISAYSIKEEIKNIINSEKKEKPYSDKKIQDILKEKDIDIARRTIAKYREELGFLSSSKRKKI